MFFSTLITLVGLTQISSASNPCTGKSDGYMVCPVINSQNFVLCSGGAGTNLTVTQPCSGALQCCESAQNCVYAGSCPDKTPGAGAIQPPAVLVPLNSTQAPQAPAYWLPVGNTAPPTTQPPTPASQQSSVQTYGCQGSPDDAFVCSDATHFTFCKNGSPFVQDNQSCQQNLVCCQSTMQCTYPGTCPDVAPSYVPAPYYQCTNAPDYSFICSNPNQFTYCLKGQSVLTQVQSCQKGLVCCQSTQQCTYPGTCPSGDVVGPHVVVPGHRHPARSYKHHPHKPKRTKTFHHHRHNNSATRKYTKKHNTTTTSTTMTSSTTTTLTH